jgi:hypothetical protein
LEQGSMDSLIWKIIHTFNTLKWWCSSTIYTRAQNLIATPKVVKQQRKPSQADSSYIYLRDLSKGITPFNNCMLLSGSASSTRSTYERRPGLPSLINPKSQWIRLDWLQSILSSINFQRYHHNIKWPMPPLSGTELPLVVLPPMIPRGTFAASKLINTLSKECTPLKMNYNDGS